jgi:hypothetical protein
LSCQNKLEDDPMNSSMSRWLSRLALLLAAALPLALIAADGTGWGP